MPVIITESAANRFKSMITPLGPIPRIEIVAGGCNGFEKRFSMDNQREDDICIDLPNGACVLIDGMSYDLLSNSTVDYKTSLTGNYFSIEIPESTSTCGCGTSFSL